MVLILENFDNITLGNMYLKLNKTLREIEELDELEVKNSSSSRDILDLNLNNSNELENKRERLNIEYM